MSINKVDIEDNPEPPDGDSWERKVIDAVRGIRYGSVEVVVHDAQVVQIERREKVRLDETGRRRPDHRWRETNDNGRTDRSIGGSEPRETGEKNR